MKNLLLLLLAFTIGLTTANATAATFEPETHQCAVSPDIPTYQLTLTVPDLTYANATTAESSPDLTANILGIEWIESSPDLTVNTIETAFSYKNIRYLYRQSKRNIDPEPIADNAEAHRESAAPDLLTTFVS